MNYQDARRIIIRIAHMNSNRLAELRSPAKGLPTDDENAEYASRLKEKDKLDQLLVELTPSTATEAAHLARYFPVFSSRGRPDMVYDFDKFCDMMLDNATAGMGEPRYNRKGMAAMTEADADFLRSCGIKGEIW